MRKVNQKAASAPRTKKQTEDLTTNKMLLVFGASTVYLFLMILFKNGAVMIGQSRPAAASICYALLGLVLLALVSIGLIDYYRKRRAGRCPQYRLVNGLNIALASLTVFCCSAAQYLLGIGDMGMKVTYLVVIAAAALSVIYWIFRRECFLSMLVLGVSAIVYYLLYRLPYAFSIWMNAWKFLGVVYALALAAGAVVLFVLKRSRGMLRIGKRTVRFLDAGFNYWPVFAAFAFAALAFAAGILFGTSCFYYAVFASAIALVAYGVYSILLLI